MIVEKSKFLISALIVAVFFFLFGLFVNSPLLNAQDSEYKSRNFVDASSNNFPPMNILDKDGNLAGFGKDLSDAVVKAIGGRVTHIHSAHWSQVLGWLDSGKADFIHDTGYTEDRDEFLDYSDPIIEMPEVIFIRQDRYDITGFDSLKGRTVACVNKHISHLYLQKFPEIKCHIVKTPVEGLYELVAGKVDAFVYPKQIILYLVQELRLGDKIKIVGEPLRTLTWSMVVKEGNEEVLRLLNEGISEVRETGEYKRIYNKWWGEKVLAGYSTRELLVITSLISGTLLMVTLSISLLLFNRRLLRDKKEIEAEANKRKRAEEELREHEELLRTTIESTADGILVLNGKGQVSYLNTRFASMWNIPDDALKSIEAVKLINHILDKLEEPNVFDLKVDRIYKISNKAFDTLSLRDGRNIEFYSYPLIRRGETAGCVWTFRDITENKRTQEALRDSEERFRSLVETTSDWIWEVDLDSKYTYASPKVKDLLGYKPEEIIGKNAFEFMLADEASRVGTKFQTIIESQRFFEGLEHTTLHKDGRRVILETSGVPLIDKHGNLLGYFGIDRDITERKRAEEELVKHREGLEELVQERTAELNSRVSDVEYLNRAMVNLLEDLRSSNANLETTTSRLAEANKELEAFTYSVSHDLRSPLRAISGFSRMLVEDYMDKLDSDGRHQLDVIQGSARDMGQLIDDLLAFSRMGRKEMSSSVIDMGGLVREVFEKLQLLPEASKARLKAEELAPAYGDLAMIREVFFNLLSNAIKFRKPQKAPVIEVGSRTEGEEQIYSVRDNGVGFDMKYVDKLFAVFQRLHSTEEFEGTGIGLALVQRIIHRHGGRVWAEGKVNEGATFYFTLPREKEREDG